MDVFSSIGVRRRSKYVLKKKNQPLAEFHLTMEVLGEIRCEITTVVSTEPAEFPFNLPMVDKDLLDWLNSRFIPKNRAFVDKILAAMPGEDHHLVNLLNVTLGLSLTDDYWILPESHYDLLWEDHNLYENEFSDTLALVAFTGYDAKVKGIASSPEFTTNGMLPKCWRRIGNKVYLYKGGTEGYANSGLEPYSEFYAAQVAEAMEIDHVKYDLEMWKGKLCSVCPLFTSESYSFVPAHVAYPSLSSTELLRKVYGTPFYGSLVDMLVFDAVIANHDRHYGNFGFLRNNISGKLEAVAPIFDNGMSLLHQAMDSDFADLKPYLDWRAFTFANLKDSQLRDIQYFMSPEQKKKIKKLFNFEFQEHPAYNLPKKRLDTLSEFVRNRAVMLSQ